MLSLRRRNVFLFSVVLPAFVGVALGASLMVLHPRLTTPGLDSPRLVLESDQHDFGDVLVGESVAHRFRIQNEGSSLLTISDVRTSCGCAPAHLDLEAIPPGGIAFLTITFNAQAKAGLVGQSVMFRTNDPEHPEVSLPFQARVRAPLEASPSELSIGVVSPGQTVSHPLELSSSDGSPFAITDIRPSASWIRLERVPAESRQRYAYRVLLCDPPAGSFSEFVRFSTSSTTQRELFVSVRGQIVSGPMFQPASLLLPPTSPGDVVRAHVIISVPAGSEAFVVDSLALDDSAWTVVSSESVMLSPQSLRLDLRLRVPLARGYQRTALVLRSSRPLREHRLPLSCLITEPDPPVRATPGIPQPGT